jgi:gentisate 1,2-dioxygenase
LPGETAPNHKHTIGAVRLIIEGEGGFTTVGGERCPMEKGDVILTPAGRWHQHEHAGTAPVIWLDASMRRLSSGAKPPTALQASRRTILTVRVSRESIFTA